MTKTKRIILICICSLLIVATMVAMVFAAINYYGGKNKAHAEFTDLAGTNTLVNFNQLYNITGYSVTNSANVSAINSNSFKINSTLTDGAIALLTASNLQNGHRYYIFGNNNQAFRFVDSNGNAFGESIDYIYSPSNNRTLYYLNYNSVYGSYNIGDVVVFNIIDLTQMFGDNEPNLQEAKEYFTAEYYNYNTGTAVSNNSVESYNQGVKSVYDSLYYTMNTELIVRNAQPYYWNIDNSMTSTVERVDPNGQPYTSQLVFEHGVFIPFSTALPINSSVQINMKFAYKQLETNLNCDVYFIDNLGNVQFLAHWGELFTWPEDIQGTDYSQLPTKSFTYTTNANAVGLIIIEPQPTSLNKFVFMYLDLQFRTGDISVLLDSSKSEIERLVKMQYENYYAQGGAGYQTIWDKGFNAGSVSNGDTTLSTMQYVGAAFQGIGEILQIELLPGIPFSLFVLLPLMVSLIFFVVKLTKGGS